jgi:ribonuclease HI
VHSPGFGGLFFPVARLLTLREKVMKKVVIVCDGSSVRDAQGRPSAGAAALLDYAGKRKIVGEYLEGATNQQAEIVAAAIGLEALKKPCVVEVMSDSEYLIRTMKGEYRRKANHPFWERLDRAAARHRVTWRWIAGHTGHPLHDVCDRAARLIARGGRVDEQDLAALLDRSVARRRAPAQTMAEPSEQKEPA